MLNILPPEQLDDELLAIRQLIAFTTTLLAEESVDGETVHAYVMPASAWHRWRAVQSGVTARSIVDRLQAEGRL